MPRFTLIKTFQQAVPLRPYSSAENCKLLIWKILRSKAQNKTTLSPSSLKSSVCGSKCTLSMSPQLLNAFYWFLSYNVFSPVFRTFFPLSLYIQYTCLIGTMHSCLWPFGRSQPFLLSEPTPPWEADALALFQRDIQRSSWARGGYRHIPYICFHCFHPSPCIWEGAKRWAFPSALVPPSHSCCMSQRPPKGQTTRLCMLLW